MILQITNIIRKSNTAGLSKEFRDSFDDVSRFIFLHATADLLALLTMVRGVCKSVRIDKTKPGEDLRIMTRKRECYVATHRVPHHYAAVHTSLGKHTLHHPRHKIHSMDITECTSKSMTRKVDSDDTEMIHIGDNIGTPHIKALQVAMKKD